MSEDRPGEAGEGRPLWWLAAGAAVGVAAAAWGLLTTDPALGSLPGDAVARVNHSVIYAEEYGRLVAGLESDTREVASEEVRQRVLDRMIDEELLVQRGIELGLAESDRRVRADITQAMIRSVVVEAEDQPPSDRELRRFYDQEKGFFTQPGRLRVRQVFFRVPGAQQDAATRARAAQAHERLVAGDPFDAVRETYGDEEVSRVPNAPLPPAKLREYLGPTVLRTVMEMDEGAFSAPVRSGTGYHVLELLQREPQRTPPFEEVAEQVRTEWTRRAGDRALRGYLDELRERADVEVRTELP